jgi:molecular chaperone HtpG
MAHPLSPRGHQGVIAVDGKYIRSVREQRQLTQIEFAEALQLSVRTIQNLENGSRKPKQTELMAISKYEQDNPLRAMEAHHKMGLDFQGLIKILAGHLYSKKEIFIRELIQNSHDAIWRRSYTDQYFKIDQGRIDIVTDLTKGAGRLLFRDNGLGMTEEDLVSFLGTIGRSGTQETKGDAKEVIGQFGIGFLAGFVVADRIEVRTRHFAARPEQACLWTSNGDQNYSIAPANMDQPGTEVTIFLKDAKDHALLQDEMLRTVITTYADMLTVAIHVNDPQHTRSSVNMRIMPWEREALSASEMRLENMIYLERRMPDSVLEVIPVKDTDVEGLLYITSTRVIGRDAPRTMRVFLKRMFLCDGAVDLLPQWASFVNGILNTTNLQPNAARDKYIEDGNFTGLRDRLGALVIAHLEGLKTSNAQRLSEILAYHDFSIKAACHYYDPFFVAFGHLLEWSINPGSPILASKKNSIGPKKDKGAGDHLDKARSALKEPKNADWMTLPELLAAIPIPSDGGPKRLSCFTSSAAASQYFEMADAARSTVIDASGPFEEELLKDWAKRHESEVTLVQVDRQDDPNVFREIDSLTDTGVKQLAQYMSTQITIGDARLLVEARRFSPTSVTSVLRNSPESANVQKARSMLTDPNASGEIKKLAEELLRMNRCADQRMFINADNPLVRSLANLVASDPKSEDALEVAMGLYNSAILANSQSMGTSNASIFAAQYQRLMHRVMEFAKMRDELSEKEHYLEEKEATFERARAEAQPRACVERTHLQGFYITPFSFAFDAIRQSVRDTMEVEFQCELLSADQRKLCPWISESVRAHISQADFFVIDLTDLISLNVLIETGAISYGRPHVPALYIASVERPGDSPQLPTDLSGLIVNPYVKSATPSEWQSSLAARFRSDVAFSALLNRNGRQRYVSSNLLHKWSNQVINNSNAREKLSRLFPTVSAWTQSDRESIAAVLRPYNEADIADVVRSRIVASANEPQG